MPKVSIFCVKCRQKRDLEATMGPIKWNGKNGTQSRNGYSATCSTCGTRCRKFAPSGEKSN